MYVTNVGCVGQGSATAAHIGDLGIARVNAAAVDGYRTCFNAIEGDIFGCGNLNTTTTIVAQHHVVARHKVCCVVCFVQGFNRCAVNLGHYFLQRGVGFGQAVFARL